MNSVCKIWKLSHVTPILPHQRLSSWLDVCQMGWTWRQHRPHWVLFANDETLALDHSLFYSWGWEYISSSCHGWRHHGHFLVNFKGSPNHLTVESLWLAKLNDSVSGRCRWSTFRQTLHQVLFSLSISEIRISHGTVSGCHGLFVCFFLLFVWEHYSWGTEEETIFMVLQDNPVKLFLPELSSIDKQPK